MRTANVLLLSAVFGVLAFCYGYPSNAGEREEAVADEQDCSVLAWVPYWDQRAAMTSFVKHAELIDYLSVFWYHLTPEGDIGKYRRAREDKKVIELAHEQGVKVLALVANLVDDKPGEDDNEEWDVSRVRMVIRSAEKRREHIVSLLKLVDKMGFDGINIDYEALPGDLREEFTAFAKELGAALHQRGKLLAIAVHPKTGEGKGSEDNGSHAQDWDALSQYADQLHLMTYGEHDVNTKPGPIASPEWISTILRYARQKRKVPSEKLFFGIPLYAEAWESLGFGRYRTATASLTYMDVERAVMDFGVEPKWDGKSASPTLSFESRNGRKRIIWFENGRSIKKKLAIAKRFRVCNVGLWRLGGEDPDTWKVLRDHIRHAE